MRPRRGTELHGRGVFLALVILGALAATANVIRLVAEPISTLGAVSAAGLIVVGAYGVWRGGYMLEWWGPPESEDR